jgi:Clostripain family
MKKRKWYLLVVGVLIVSVGTLSCGGGGGGSSSPATNSGPRQWTYMVYMGADNTLSDAGLYNLNDMEKVGSSGPLAIVVQAEFSTQYTAGMPTSNTSRIYVQNDNDPTQPNLNAGILVGNGNVDMANPASLTDFINWTKTNYPAQHYALVVWDHGAGWKAKKLSATLKGAVEDDTSGTFMSLPDLAKGVADSGVHFDVINFDACLMAMYEVAYEFRGLADYMVLSEQTEPGTGDPYDTILGALAANPAMSGRTLATTIVDKYNAFYVPDTRESSTKSAIDMSQIDTLDTKIVALATALQNDPSTTTAVQLAQANTQSYAYPANHDIYDFCQYLNSRVTGTAKTLTSDIITLMGSVVVDNKYTGTDVANSHGLAIYIPQPDQTNTSDLTDYAKLKCNLTTRSSAGGTWGSYVEALLGGSSLQQTGIGNFALYLYWTKPDGSACNADLDLYIAEPDGSGGSHWYSPWMGQTTPNGFFSQESSQAGQSLEYYVANEQVTKGNYVFLVNYYANAPASSPTCTQAAAHILYMDPVTVNGTWTEATGSPVLLDLSNKAPGTVTDINTLITYSDWWSPGYLTRTAMATGGALLTGLDLPINTRNSMLIFRNSRGSVLNGITP